MTEAGQVGLSCVGLVNDWTYFFSFLFADVISKGLDAAVAEPVHIVENAV